MVTGSAVTAMDRVVLLIVDRALDPVRQAGLLFAAAEQRGWKVVAVSRSAVECVAAVRRGEVGRVLAVVADPGLDDLGDLVAVLRPARRALRTQVDLVDLVRRWRERGLSVPEIAELLALDVVQVELLSSLGSRSPLPGGRRARRID